MAQELAGLVVYLALEVTAPLIQRRSRLSGVLNLSASVVGWVLGCSDPTDDGESLGQSASPLIGTAERHRGQRRNRLRYLHPGKQRDRVGSRA